jgi:hypothetical protein
MQRAGAPDPQIGCARFISGIEISVERQADAVEACTKVGCAARHAYAAGVQR